MIRTTLTIALLVSALAGAASAQDKMATNAMASPMAAPKK